MRNLHLSYFLPLLEKLNVILLSLLLYHLIVLVHLSHEFDVPLMHFLHVLLYFQNVLFCKFNRDEATLAFGASTGAYKLRVEFRIPEVVVFISLIVLLVLGGADLRLDFPLEFLF